MNECACARRAAASNLVGGRLGSRIADILPDRRVEKICFLKDHPDLSTQGVEGDIPEVLAIYENSSRGGIEKPGHKIEQGGLAGATGPGNRHEFAGRHSKA